MKRLALPIFCGCLCSPSQASAQLQKFRAANGVSEKTKEGNP